MKYYLWTAGLVCLLMSPLSLFSQNLQPQDIVTRLHDNQMTIYTDLEDFRPEDLLTRWEGAKMITKFAESLQLQQDYPWSCEFQDIAEYDITLTPYITSSCRYGLLKWWNWLFTPTGTLTQAQALVTIQRARSGFQNEDSTPRYREYFQDAVQLGIVSTDQILSVSTTPITRFELGVWLYRASWNWSNTIDTTVYIPQWAVEVPPVVVAWENFQPQTAPKITTSPTIKPTTPSRTTKDETKLAWGYTRNFNYDTYQPYSDATLQLELAAGRRMAIVFWSQSSLQSRALDNNIRQWVRGNVSILFVEYELNTELRNRYGVSSIHTVVYLDTNGNTLFSTIWRDTSVNQIIQKFDEWLSENKNSTI